MYGPLLKREREGFWSKLGAIKGLWSDPWCVAGDFSSLHNEVVEIGCLRL